MEPLFKDKAQQDFFDKNGYVKVRLFTNQQADELVKCFNDTRTQHQTVKNLHHTTTDTENPELIYPVDAKIKELFVPELDKIMQNYQALVGTFHIKEPGPRSETGIHQDPTFVDEDKYCSANVWVALQDIDEHNGNLFFVNGSNHALKSLRVTPYSRAYYDSFYGDLEQMSTSVPLKKGEAVIFNNATIHGATENLSNDIRLAATVLVCSAPAQWMLYYHDKTTANNKIEKYHLDLETFVAMPKDGRPDKKAFKEFVSYNFPEMTKDEFIKITKGGTVQKPNFIQQLLNVFRAKKTV